MESMGGAKVGKSHLDSNLISIGRDALETAGTPALSGVYLLCKLVF